MKVLTTTALVCLAATAGHAATTGFDMTITGNNNVPTMTLTNSGDTGQISGFDISIGDTAYNFDALYLEQVLLGSFSFTRTSGDANDRGGTRVDQGSYTFLGFDPGEQFLLRLDIDIDNSNTVEDYQLRMLPGGSLTVFFDGGLTNSLTVDLTPGTGNNSEPYSYSASVADNPVVPLPAGGVLLLAGLASFGVMRRR